MALSLFADGEPALTDAVTGDADVGSRNPESARLFLQKAGFASPPKIRRRRRSGLGSCASTASNEAAQANANANESEGTPTPTTSLQKALKKRWENTASSSKSKSKSRSKSVTIKSAISPMVLANQFKEHDGDVEFELEWYQKIAASLWQSDILRAQGSHLSHHFGVSDYVVKMTQQRLVLAAIKAHDKACFGALKHLDAFGFASGQYKPHLFLNVRQYDETPVVLRVASSGAKDADVQCCKLFVTEARIGALYLGTDGDIKKDFLVESQVPCVLQVLQSNAANILATALHKSGSSGHGGGRPWHQSVAQNFCKLVHVVTTDNFSSNWAAERLLTESEEKLLASVPWQRLNHLCLICDLLLSKIYWENVESVLTCVTQV